MVDERLSGYAEQAAVEWAVRFNRQNHSAMLQPGDEGALVTICGHAYAVLGAWQPGENLWQGHVDGLELAVQIERRGACWRLRHGGAVLDMEILTPRAAQLADLMPVKLPPDMSRFLLSPMPGLLASLAVKDGEEVRAGQELAGG